MAASTVTDDVVARAERVAQAAAKDAERVDREAAFPKAAVDALREEGLFGLVSAADVGGKGRGLREAALVVERLARECGSAAMVTCMHYAGASVVEAHGPLDARRAIAKGEHLSTLAFSEAGSRSHFWAPLSTARKDGQDVVLDAKKSWITSVRHATAYVWSSKPVSAEGASTLWLVPAKARGLTPGAPFEGLGLRGNDSSPLAAEGVRVAESARLGNDGQGFDIMMGVVLPRFAVMNAACSVGLMEAATTKAAAHCGGAKYAHLSGTSLAELPTIRAYVARARIRTDATRALLMDTIAALEESRPDAMLRVLEVKAAAGDAALEVTEAAMRVCGGMAFRKEVGVERLFRDARAASVMAPTSDQLFDFIGKAVCGLPLFG